MKKNRSTRADHACAHKILSVCLALTASPLAFAGSSCNLTDLAGRYIGLDNGYIQIKGQTTPLARLYLEDWDTDGHVTGTVWQRQGVAYQKLRYQGHLNLSGDCTASLNRTLSSGKTWQSSLIITEKSHQAYSIDQMVGSTTTGSLSPQTVTHCTAATLKGMVYSSQAGFSLRQHVWKPNAVIQREQHDGQGGLQGLAISSYAGQPENMHYAGQFALEQDCTGSLKETDQQGNQYNYRVIVSGQGYYYLQTDPGDLTGAYLGSNPR